MASKGHAKWEGDLKGGKGVFTAGEDITGQYSFKSRFEDGPGANPEQLIAAAHAACFSMALSNILAEAGHNPTSVEASAAVQLRLLDDGPTITSIALTVVGVVPGLSEEHFLKHAEEAKAGCPVSKALAGVKEITMDAKLG
ncbi:Peroxiredoxin OsmC [Paraconexibacter sp. AEG42_29]|uniref:Peroxiredoxin OsmC n=1 Tax=Paraconexibacter sp. AEG42_29 TaxID=2997339 RepID=A0AAU7ANX7_9ACTN